MQFIKSPLKKEEIQNLKNNFGNYLKLTIDIENECLVAGSELHADGEKMLLETDSQQDNIWGGGIDLVNKQIDTTAVLNLRPKLDNDGLDILNSQRREKFIKIVRKIFEKL